MKDLELKHKMKQMSNDIGLPLNRFSNFKLIADMVLINKLAK